MIPHALKVSATWVIFLGWSNTPFFRFCFIRFCFIKVCFIRFCFGLEFFYFNFVHSSHFCISRFSTSSASHACRIKYKSGGQEKLAIQFHQCDPSKYVFFSRVLNCGLDHLGSVLSGLVFISVLFLFSFFYCLVVQFLRFIDLCVSGSQIVWQS